MFPYDAALLAALDTRPQTIPAVIATMDALDALLAEDDGLKWFGGLYLQVTRAVAARIDTGGFADPAWMTLLDVHFANLYFDALRLDLSGQSAPGAWRALFDRRAQGAIARVQFALAGVNAHINRDLPVALAESYTASGYTPQRGTPQFTDYTSVNATLDGLIETAKRELMVRLNGDALPAVSHLEDTLGAFGIAAARDGAWTNSEILWNVRGTPALASGFLDALDGLTTVAGKSLLAPVAPFAQGA